jgi:hypothetical protein
LDLSNFYKKKNGYQYSCKDCTKEKVYAWRKEKVQKRWDKIFIDENILKEVLKP